MALLEGMRYDDVLVLTQAELNRLVAELSSSGCTVCAARETDSRSQYALLARQTAFRRSSGKRYARYTELRKRFGLKASANWSTELTGLERRAGIDNNERAATQTLTGERVAAQTGA